MRSAPKLISIYRDSIHLLTLKLDNHLVKDLVLYSTRSFSTINQDYEGFISINFFSFGQINFFLSQPT